MYIKNLEQKYDLKKRSYCYCLEMIKFLKCLERNDYLNDVIKKQLLRSATSIGANIHEAQSGCSKKEFTNFYAYSLRSANETKFWLGIIKDSGLGDNLKVDKLLLETRELSNILASSILRLRGKK